MQFSTHVFNLSIEEGVFPKELKIARGIPLFKFDNCMLVINYRPVSVLQLFSKILEKIMYNRILAFINKHDLLYKFQFGFRGKHETDIVLIVLVDKIMSAFNDGEMVLGALLDLSKAFDNVDHDILLNKLNMYGIRGTAHDWFRSYLFQRKQFVAFNGSTSNHYDDVIMTTIASQVTSLTSVYSTVYSDADQRKLQSSRHWPLCGEFTGTGEFPAQRASYAENVSIWWRHHVNLLLNVGFHKGLFWGHYSFYCISMIWSMYQLHCFHCYLQMT